MKKELKTQLTRERIIESALLEFSENGYKAFVINELCKKYSISKGVLYHNFSGKNELYLECVKQSFQKAISFIKGDGNIPGIKEYMERRHKFFKEYPCHSKIFFEAWLCPPKNIYEEIQDEKLPFIEFNNLVCDKLLSESKLRDDVDKDSAKNYLIFIQDMFRSYFYSKADLSNDIMDLGSKYEDTLNAILDMMLYGIIQYKSEK